MMPHNEGFRSPLIRLHSYLVSKERLLLVATFQDCFNFENKKNVLNIIKILILKKSFVYHSIRYMSG